MPEPTGPVTADVAEAEPAVLLAVTDTRIVEPTSALLVGYVEALTPVAEHEPALQRCHW
ncbi:MAG: hypothetical protein JO130_01415 [Solirubrobacterales bacterium]|nr:hypothetical protein [Solirubrobacterales bacterium]